MFRLDASFRPGVSFAFYLEKILRSIAPRRCGNRCGWGILLSCFMIWYDVRERLGNLSNSCSCGACGPMPTIRLQDPCLRNPRSHLSRSARPEADPIAQWEGLTVRTISFEGVSPRSALLPSGPSRPGRWALRSIGRRWPRACARYLKPGFSIPSRFPDSGEGDGVELVFRGKPRMFIGVVTVDGAKGATVNTQLERASRLNAGTRFTTAKMTEAVEQMRAVLVDNGFNESTITYDLHRESRAATCRHRLSRCLRSAGAGGTGGAERAMPA